MRLPALLTLSAALLFTAALSFAEDPAPAKDVGSISGKVVDKDGKGVKGAMVAAVAPEARRQAKHGDANVAHKKQADTGDAKPEAPAGPRRPEFLAQTTTNDDGTFKLEKVPVGKVIVFANLRATGRGRTPEPVDVKANEETKLAAPITLQAGPRAGRQGKADKPAK